MERTHQVLQVGDAVYAARQSGLYRIDGGSQRNLFAGWQDDLAALCLLALDDSLLAGMHGGVARTLDGGASWDAHAFRMPAPLVTCLCDAGDGLLAGTFADGVFRSEDGGMSWQPRNHGLFDHSVNCLRACSDGGLIYAGTSTGVYRSENGGRLWQDIELSGDETVLCLALADDEALYAGCETHGLLRIDGAGIETVNLEAGAVNGLALGAGWLAAQVDDRALVSRDGGASWRTIAAANVDCLAQDADSLILAMADGTVTHGHP